jgi:hypothetical protein
LAKIRRVPRSSTGQLTLKLMPFAAAAIKNIPKVYDGQQRHLIGIGIFFSRLLFLLTRNTLVHYLILLTTWITDRRVVSRHLKQVGYTPGRRTSRS